ncbi:MAG: hypothetical protein ACYDAO_04310 [Thermoplasmataceae archaeon]
MTERNLYWVEEGEARKLKEVGGNGMIRIPETDGINSIIVAAYNKKHATRIAALYDAGKLNYDNIAISGHTYNAVYVPICDHDWNEDIAPYGVTQSDHESILAGDSDA